MIMEFALKDDSGEGNTMNNVSDVGPFSLRKVYRPQARYHKLADFVEYVPEDKPYIMRRIDNVLTIALDMETRKLAGFRIKGFRNFFLKHLKPRHKLLDEHFLALVAIIEIAATLVGNDGFATGDEKKDAYKQAYSVAVNDRVVLIDFPEAA